MLVGKIEERVADTGDAERPVTRRVKTEVEVSDGDVEVVPGGPVMRSGESGIAVLEPSGQQEDIHGVVVDIGTETSCGGYGQSVRRGRCCHVERRRPAIAAEVVGDTEPAHVKGDRIHAARDRGLVRVFDRR